MEALRDYYISAIKELRPGITEIFLHPALPIANMTPEWQKRVCEYEILKSGILRKTAEECGVEIIRRGEIKALIAK